MSRGPRYGLSEPLPAADQERLRSRVEDRRLPLNELHLHQLKTRRRDRWLASGPREEEQRPT